MKKFTLGACAALALACAPLYGCGTDGPTGPRTVSDNFDDGKKDSKKWGEDSDQSSEDGAFHERDGVLEATGSTYYYLDRPWIATQFPHDGDWEVQIDLENAVDPEDEEKGQYPSMGIAVFNEADRSHRFRYELYTDTHDHYRGFYLDVIDLAGDTHEIPDLTRGAVRIVFDSEAELLRLYYDVDTDDGYQWVAFHTISIGEGGPATKYVDWEMTDADRFSVSVYANGGDLVPGELRADNFVTTGGVKP